MPPPPEFRLSDQERESPLWRRIEAHLTDKLDAARRKNDHAIPEVATASIRGEINLLKALISLGKSGQPTGE